MRGYSFFAAFLTARRVLGHPLCYIDSRPTDYDQVLTFCPEAQHGACCTDAEEAEVQARVEAAGTLTDDCADLYTQVRDRRNEWYCKISVVSGGEYARVRT